MLFPFHTTFQPHLSFYAAHQKKEKKMSEEKQKKNRLKKKRKEKRKVEFDKGGGVWFCLSLPTNLFEVKLLNC